MYELRNEHLIIRVNSLGAELQSIRSVSAGTEYLWQGDPSVWSGRAPILFPIVGTLKDGKYLFDQRTYHLPRHGLARTANFQTLSSEPHRLCQGLSSDGNTKQIYPWDFDLQIQYSLRESCIDIEYKVTNTGSVPMRFAIGSHPAFRLPKPLDVYSIRFSDQEVLLRYPLNGEGLLTENGMPYELADQRIPLHESLFDDDALVFKNLRSSIISLYDKSDELLRVHTGGAPHLGIWAKPNAPFVCIEPWFGHSDSPVVSGQWEDKPAMQVLERKEVFSYRWTIEIVLVR